MLASWILRLTLSVVALSTLVLADFNSIITMNSVKVTNNANDYFNAWEAEITQTKRSSQLTVKLPTKKELPESMMMKIILQIKDQVPIEYESAICEALNDITVGKSFVDAGLPKDKFPKKCPFGAGDWTVSKWDPPIMMIPPGIPDGPILGTFMIMEEGKDDPIVQLEFDGQLSHKW